MMQNKHERMTYIMNRLNYEILEGIDAINDAEERRKWAEREYRE